MMIIVGLLIRKQIINISQWNFIQELLNDNEYEKLIIIYDSSISITKDGNLSIYANKDDIESPYVILKKWIYINDLKKKWKNYISSHEFWNTSVDKGYLNKYGYKMIAEELYKIIKNVK